MSRSGPAAARSPRPGQQFAPHILEVQLVVVEVRPLLDFIHAGEVGQSPHRVVEVLKIGLEVLGLTAPTAEPSAVQPELLNLQSRGALGPQRNLQAPVQLLRLPFRLRRGRSLVAGILERPDYDREDGQRRGNGEGIEQSPMPPCPLMRPLQPGHSPGVDRLAVEESPQVLGEFPRGLVALVPRPGHRLQDHVSRSAGTAALCRRGGIGSAWAIRSKHGRPVVAGDGGLQRQKFVQRRTQRVDVGPVVHDSRLGLRLFRAHVPQACPAGRR